MGIHIQRTDSAGGDLTGTYPNPTVVFANDVVHTLLPTVTTRSASVDTVYQPSTTRDTLVCASVEISTGVAGNGKIEAMSDSANPPTTIAGTFRVSTAVTDVGAQLTFIVKANNYYKLKTTSIAGSPSFSVVGSVYEYTL